MQTLRAEHDTFAASVQHAWVSHFSYETCELPNTLGPFLVICQV